MINILCSNLLNVDQMFAEISVILLWQIFKKFENSLIFFVHFSPFSTSGLILLCPTTLPGFKALSISSNKKRDIIII